MPPRNKNVPLTEVIEPGLEPRVLLILVFTARKDAEKCTLEVEDGEDDTGVGNEESKNTEDCRVT